MSELPAWATQINSDYLQERVRRYNEAPSDDLLYRMGSCMDTLTSEDEKLLRKSGYVLTPEQRYRVLNQLLCNGFEIECDLALLIFGRQQLEQWLEISRQAYPDFKFYLAFEYHERQVTGWESGINYTCFWMPLPGAPTPSTDNDFPWKLYWECGGMFWNDFPNNTTTDFDFTLSCYPNQQSFTDSNWILEEGDWQCIPSDQEADLMSVDQVLQHFTVPA
jgi:hypothetical protein